MTRIGIAETFGMAPLGPALRDMRRALRGDGHAQPTEWGLSSVRIFKPQIALPTWAGIRRRDRRVPIYNFFNRVPAPKDRGYSVQVTYCRDFRGGRWTYDGHLGTDFAVPVGTPVVAGAPGIVVRVHNEMDRGGLKVCIDHGDGLFTTSNHLARALVRPGDRVGRGDVVGLSGASGMEFVLCFPWVAPHLHYNVWLNGEPVDPFAIEGEVSLWRRPNDPVPHDGRDVPDDGDVALPSPWDPDGVEASIEACRDPRVRERCRRIDDPGRRAAEVLVMRNYHPVLFEAFPPLYRRSFERRPRLDLPFRREDFVGAWLPPVQRSRAAR